MKVQAQIQGDAIRVSGKSKDDLQRVITRLREESEGAPDLADAIRNRVGIPTVAVGVISSYDDVNSILLAGRADRIRTFAFGVIVDPNISRPLPFAGRWGRRRMRRRRWSSGAMRS